MGIRIQRQFGYGLLVDEGDPRVNWNLLEKLWYHGTRQVLDAGWTRESLQQFIDQYDGDSKVAPSLSWSVSSLTHMVEDGFKFTSSIHSYNEEVGMPAGKVAVIVTPPVFSKEGRESDTLFLWGDYETNHPELLRQSKGLVTEFAVDPFPYEGMLIDEATRTQLRGIEAWRFFRDGQLNERNISESEILAGTPYSSLGELKAKAKLLPPRDVVLLLEWLGVFTSRDVVDTVKPLSVIYFE